MDRTKINHWRQLHYRNPETVLRELRTIEIAVMENSSEISPQVRTLRTNGLKPIREFRQAAIFCHGMAHQLGCPVHFAPVEDDDYDFVAAYTHVDCHHFVPVQLKELVPNNLNETATLDEILRSLRKYPSSKDLTVVIYINRQGTVTPCKIEAPNLNIGALWLVCATTPDASNWILIGDMLTEPMVFPFSIPV